MAKRAKAHIATLLSEIADLYGEGAEGAGGHISVTVEYEDQKETLSLHSVAGSGPSLVGRVVGRDWLLKIRLDWQNLNRLQAAPPTHLQVIIDRHAAMFKDELRLVKDAAAKMHVVIKHSPGSTSPELYHKP